MKMRILLPALFACLAGCMLAGCGSAPDPPAADPASAARAAKDAEAHEAAEAVLGKSAEVLVHGDLARSGSEQVLAVRRLGNASGGEAGSAARSGILIVRAAIIEKSGGKWSEILLCDEHLENPNGYLGGAPIDRVTGWQLDYDSNTATGLEMKFTPGASGAEGEKPGRTIVVRWNAKTKRYQSLDASQEKYLNEIPTLETPQSILK
jgi:hypothetical protein